jgi:hypothetical protein
MPVDIMEQCKDCKYWYEMCHKIQHIFTCTATSKTCECGEVIEKELFNEHSNICILKGIPEQYHDKIVNRLKQYEQEIIQLKIQLHNYMDKQN